ncbi:hypothetical protein H4R18_000946 [Coemansia javaensis]|uniref:Peroxisomal membrane protein PEX16 n=1 Tax=Coemansia javaensis TaxID=2761396 RepID=A0A9W8LMA6_9FUNG|nr:hypothetical protein H4R18_000946 [Coemansia javaensis]
MLLQRYAEFVVANASQVNSIENGLRLLTYVLPGRFADAEVASEAIYTLLSFVGVYHDGLLARAAARGLLADKHGRPVRLDPPPATRYQARLARRFEAYRAAALLLTALQFSEKLVEMAVAKRLGERRRWQAVSCIEAAKAALRLALLRLAAGRIVPGSVAPERLVDPAALGPVPHVPPREPGAGAEAQQPHDYSDTAADAAAPWKGPRSGLEFRPVRAILAAAEHSGPALGRLVAGAARDPEAVAPPLALVRPYRALGLAGELLFILRPLAYVLGVRRFGLRDWRPWVLSLLIELASRHMVCADLRAGSADAADRSVERDELARRKWLFLYYLLRGPFFVRFTEARLAALADWCANKPLLSLLGSLIQDYRPLWKQYYFYTAGS